MKYLVFTLLLSMGLPPMVAVAEMQSSAAEQKFLSIVTPKTPIGGYTFGNDDQVVHHELSAGEIKFYADYLESILRKQINGGTINLNIPSSQEVGPALRYTKQDIHLISDSKPERLIKFEISEGMYQTYKSVLTGPFYMETAIAFRDCDFPSWPHFCGRAK